MSLRHLSAAANERVVALLNRLIEDGWTQTSLAKACGVTQPVISMALSGKTRVGYRLAARLAAVAGVSEEELIGSPFDAAALAPVSAVDGPPPRATPVEAARAMGEAEGFDLMFVRSWVPGGPPGANYTAEECWAMLKADFARSPTRVRRRDESVAKPDAVMAQMSELLESLRAHKMQLPQPKSPRPKRSR